MKLFTRPASIVDATLSQDHDQINTFRDPANGALMIAIEPSPDRVVIRLEALDNIILVSLAEPAPFLGRPDLSLGASA